MEEQFAFNGEAKNVGQKREFEFLKNMPSSISMRHMHGVEKVRSVLIVPLFRKWFLKFVVISFSRDSSQQALKAE